MWENICKNYGLEQRENLVKDKETRGRWFAEAIVEF